MASRLADGLPGALRNGRAVRGRSASRTWRACHGMAHHAQRLRNAAPANFRHLGPPNPSIDRRGIDGAGENPSRGQGLGNVDRPGGETSSVGIVVALKVEALPLKSEGQRDENNKGSPPAAQGQSAKSQRASGG
jgi:hypothetical protein